MDFPVWTLIPFVLMLLGIAAFPLIPQLAHLWEKPRLVRAVRQTTTPAPTVLGRGSRRDPSEAPAQD